MNIQALMKQAQSLQKDMMKTKEEIDNMTFTGTNSFISVIVKGTKEVIKVEINNDDISSDDKEIKGATSKLIKRVIMAVAIFFVVTIVTLVMNLFTVVEDDDVTEGTADWRKCWDKAGE